MKMDKKECGKCKKKIREIDSHDCDNCAAVFCDDCKKESLETIDSNGSEYIVCPNCVDEEIDDPDLEEEEDDE